MSVMLIIYGCEEAYEMRYLSIVKYMRSENNLVASQGDSLNLMYE